MRTKKEIMQTIFEWMEKFISRQISGEEFSNLYMPFWDKDLREAKDNYDKKSYSDKEHEILDELHTDCDCLNYPIETEEDKKISLTDEQLRKIVKDKLGKLKKLNNKIR